MKYKNTISLLKYDLLGYGDKVPSNYRQGQTSQPLPGPFHLNEIYLIKSNF
jgi:hypothetical protein